MTATTHHSPYALELKDLRKSFFGKTEIIRGVNLAVRHGERVALSAQRGGQVDVVQPHQRALWGEKRRCTAERNLDHGQETLRDQPPWALAVSRSPTSFPSSAYLRTCAAACCGAWATSTPFQVPVGLHDANARATEPMQMINLDKKRDVLAMNLTYAEQRALEIGITIGAVPM